MSSSLFAGSSSRAGGGLIELQRRADVLQRVQDAQQRGHRLDLRGLEVDADQAGIPPFQSKAGGRVIESVAVVEIDRLFDRRDRVVVEEGAGIRCFDHHHGVEPAVAEAAVRERARSRSRRRSALRAGLDQVGGMVGERLDADIEVPVLVAHGDVGAAVEVAAVALAGRLGTIGRVAGQIDLLAAGDQGRPEAHRR